MAREYAMVRLGIWADDDFRDLSPLAQHLYFVLMTAPTLSHCGVADWRPKRIAALARGWTADMVEEYGAELSDRLYVLADEDTDEVLVRSFIRNDGLMKQPNMAVAMVSAHMAVASSVLRGVIVHEVRRLSVDQPDLKCWGATASKDLLAELMERPSIDPSTYPLGNPSVHPSPNPSPNPSGRGCRKGEPKPSGSPSGNPCPTPAPAPAPTSSSHHLSAPTERAAAYAPPTPTQQPLLDVQPATETEGQRVNRLTKIYTDLVPLTKFVAVQGVVRKACQVTNRDGSPIYSDAEISDALRRLADENRTLTIESIRIALEGMPPARQTQRQMQSTTTARVMHAQSLKRGPQQPATNQRAIGGPQ